MKTGIFQITILACALMVAGASSLTAGLTGAIFTTVSDGSAVNANQYASKCAVYLDGGPGPNAPAKAAGLPDGDYYFQVTDPNGKTLLSTDAVSNRRFRVAHGVIVAYTGVGGPIHPTGMDQDHPELGAITIRLANSTCGADFLTSPNNGGVYKVWVTPVGNFIGDPTLVDNSCGGGCYHGFVPSTSKTDNFKAENGSATFCLTVQKQFLQSDGTFVPGVKWEFDVTDPLNVVNAFFTDTNGQVKVCGLAAGAYTVAENINSVVVGLTVNGMSLPPSTIYSFTWAAGAAAPVIVFQNATPTKASLTLNDEAVNGVQFVAVTPGSAGNSISVQIPSPTVANQNLSVVVTGNAILINIASNFGGNNVSTNAEVVAAVNANPAATALVTASVLNLGTSVVPVALVPQFLSGGTN
jgi:hypothetical protein